MNKASFNMNRSLARFTTLEVLWSVYSMRAGVTAVAQQPRVVSIPSALLYFYYPRDICCCFAIFFVFLLQSCPLFIVL